MRRDIIFSLILAALRGFCLFIPGKYTVGISGKKIRSNTIPRLIPFDLSEIYKPEFGSWGSCLERHSSLFVALLGEMER